MISRWIAKVSTSPRYTGEMDAQLRAELSAHLPKLCIRRFSESGLQMARVLHELALGTDTPLVAVSSYAETRSLEEFIDGFPTPSPARFQRSVQPSCVQQTRVVDNAPLRTFIPLAGQDGVIVAAVRTALTLDTPSTCLAGVEESGTWSVPIETGSPFGFAFGLIVEREPSDPESVLGTLRWEPVAGAPDSGPDTVPSFHEALRERKPLVLSHPDMGRIELSWK
jgi:hypothetical protein